MGVSWAILRQFQDTKTDDGEAFGLEVSLPSMTKAEADGLAARGHVACSYSHSIKGNVKVTTNVSI